MEIDRHCSRTAARPENIGLIDLKICMVFWATSHWTSSYLLSSTTKIGRAETIVYWSVVFGLLGWYANSDIHLFDLLFWLSWTIAEHGAISSMWFLWMTQLPPSYTVLPNSILQVDKKCPVFLCTTKYRCKQVTGVYISATSKQALMQHASVHGKYVPWILSF